MPKCPHCGEQVNAGQETCFACGRKVRARVYRQKKPMNAAVLVFVGVLVLASVVGMIVINSARAKRGKSQVYREEQARVQDSVRAAARAKRDSSRAAAQNDAAALLVDEINKLEERFDVVHGKVVKDQPSPAQTKLISQIRTEVIRLRQLAVTIADRPGPGGDSLRAQLRDGERRVRTLISDLSRAPKK